jgi:hypothetical protein
MASAMWAPWMNRIGSPPTHDLVGDFDAVDLDVSRWLVLRRAVDSFGRKGATGAVASRRDV